ncbi:MAG: histidine kinase [Ignavibacteria bacterium]|jgi:signal transduction histidine kinase|nr:histidine kinase [Ignavibacteria bacterium]MDH7528247.1 histidine kinase [Ignavibacteria bacterium]
MFTFRLSFIIIILVCSLAAQDLKSIIDSVNKLPATEYLANLYKSKSIFEENLARAKSIGYKSGEAKALNILAIIYYLMGNYEKSTEFNIQSLKIFEEIKEYEELANAYGEYGYQMKRRELAKAHQYMLKGIQIAEKYKLSKPTLAKLYDNFGVLKEMEGKVDSALLLYNKALKLKYDLYDSIGIPFSLNKIANAKALQGKFKEAYTILNQSDKFRAKEKNDFGKADNLAYYGDFFTMEGKIDSAIKYYQSSLDLSLKNGYTFLIEYCYRQLSDLYEKKSDFKNAFINFKKYSAYKDSITNLSTNQRIAELELAFETSEKDKLIAQQQLQLKQRAILFISVGTTLLFIVLAMVGLYTYQIQKRKAIAKEMDLVKQLSLEEANKKVIEEKLRISRELHDNTGSQLTFIISALDNLKYSISDESLLEKINNINNFTRSSLNELRNTIWAMKHETGNLSDLILKIRDYLNRIKPSIANLNLNVINNTQKEYRLNSAQLLNLFRIFQECLQNIIKHANATEAQIIFNDSKDGFTMQICDNGIGIENSLSLESSGLDSLKIRAEESKGKMYIEKNQTNDVSCGTKLIFEIQAEVSGN